MAVRDFQDFISHFEVKRKSGNKYQCKCPCHEDKRASLSITDAGDKPLINCFAGCDLYDILSAAGLDKSDLFYGESKEIYQQEEKWKVYAEGLISKQEGHTVRITRRYDHIDIQGNYVCSKLRCEPKTFRYGILENGRITLALPKAKKELPSFYTPDYQAFKQAVTDKKTVYYCEGCKDVDTLNRYGYQAISCGGSGDWCGDVAEVFRGAAKVIIFSDNDDPGRKLSKLVYHDLAKVCDDVQIVVATPDISKGDISDFVELYGARGLKLLANYDRDNFHLANIKTDKDGNVTKKITGAYDYAIFNFLKHTRSIFILGGMPFIYRDGVYVADVAGARLKTMIRKLIYPPFIRSTTIKRIYDLFLSDDELQKDAKTELNCQPDDYINFKDCMYSPREKRKVKHDPRYFCVNQIPHEYNPDAEPVEELDHFINWIAPKPDDRKMLLGYEGLCMNTDTKFQRFLVLLGAAGIGKSVVLAVLSAMIGQKNICNIPLDSFGERFTVIGLLHKLVNSCGDIETTVLESVDTIKKATGEDEIKAEFKGKDVVYFKSYASNIFSTNDLPIVKNERTNGFFRRLMVLKIEGKLEKVDVDLKEKLTTEKAIQYLIRLCVEELEKIYENGCIVESETSKKEVKRLRYDSDTVMAFLDAKTEKGTSKNRIKKTELFQAYKSYCEESERTPLLKNNFYRSMAAKGYSTTKYCGYDVFSGISFKDFSPDGFMKVTKQDLEDDFPFT